MSDDDKKAPDSPEPLDLSDEASVERYLDILGPDLKVPRRDYEESLRSYAERMLSALQDARYGIICDLDDLERDLEGIIGHLDAQTHEVS